MKIKFLIGPKKELLEVLLDFIFIKINETE